jgi:hypothetical protein
MIITKDEIKERLLEAGRTLKRTRLSNDERRHIVRANQSSMPRPVPEFWMSYGNRAEAEMNKVKPAAIAAEEPEQRTASAAEIGRMEEVLDRWLGFCYRPDLHPKRNPHSVVLAFAMGLSYREMAARDPLERGRTQLNVLCEQGIDMIWRRLNGNAAPFTPADAVKAMRDEIRLAGKEAMTGGLILHAFLYAVIVGYSPTEMIAAAQRNGWDEVMCERLRMLSRALDHAADRMTVPAAAEPHGARAGAQTIR